MRHKVTSASGSLREYGLPARHGEKMDDLHAEFHEKGGQGGLAKTMLHFSEGPRGRAISASSIPVAECQVPFVSVSFARDTYRESKTGRMNRDERKNRAENSVLG